MSGVLRRTIVGSGVAHKALYRESALVRKFHTNRINDGLRDSLTACRLRVNHMTRTLKQQGYRYDRL